MAQWDKLELLGVQKTGRKSPLGRGSYGRVIEVSVKEKGVCAAKVIHDLLCEEDENLQAIEKVFFNECATMSEMSHPNVVEFLGIYRPSWDDKLPWLIMEMMDTNLTSLIEKHETTDLPLHIKFSILMDTSQGLQYLHSKDIIHRDLSSNNVLLTEKMVAKIADFGMAKMVSLNQEDSKKKTRAPGTLPFMSLEALADEPEYGKPLDVFSLGCVFAHVISMQWPLPTAQTIRNGKLRVLQSEVKRREKYLTKMTYSLKLLVMHCLEDEPEDRPTITEVVEELHYIKVKPTWKSFCRNLYLFSLHTFKKINLVLVSYFILIPVLFFVIISGALEMGKKEGYKMQYTNLD